MQREERHKCVCAEKDRAGKKIKLQLTFIFIAQLRVSLKMWCSCTFTIPGRVGLVCFAGEGWKVYDSSERKLSLDKQGVGRHFSSLPSSGRMKRDCRTKNMCILAWSSNQWGGCLINRVWERETEEDLKDAWIVISGLGIFLKRIKEGF